MYLKPGHQNEHSDGRNELCAYLSENMINVFNLFDLLNAPIQNQREN